MAGDAACGSLCIKMHDPKTQGSKTDASEASIHPVSAVLHITSDGVKSNQYLIEQKKNEQKDNEQFMLKKPKQPKPQTKNPQKPPTQTNKPQISNKIHGHWELWISLFYELAVG